jgi:hypothetical protein
MEFGVCYREATIHEQGRYGRKHVWDWQEGCLWRPERYKVAAFDPLNPGQGKNYQASPPSQSASNSALLEALIPAVAAAVAKSMHGNSPAAPANIDPKDWDAFLQFKAWQKSAEASKEVVAALNEPDPTAGTNALTTSLDPDDDDRSAWEAEAERKGIQVDKRWGLKRLKAEVEKAA